MEVTNEQEPVSAFVWAGLIFAALSTLFVVLSIAEGRGIFGPLGSVGMAIASGALGLSVLGRFRSQKKGVGTLAIVLSAFLAFGVAFLFLALGLIIAATR